MVSECSLAKLHLVSANLSQQRRLLRPRLRDLVRRRPNERREPDNDVPEHCETAFDARRSTRLLRSLLRRRRRESCRRSKRRKTG